MLWFSPLLKNQPTRDQVDKEPLSGCATSKSLFIYFTFSDKKEMFKRKSKETRQHRVFKKFEDLNEYFIYVFTYFVIWRIFRLDFRRSQSLVYTLISRIAAGNRA